MEIYIHIFDVCVGGFVNMSLLAKRMRHAVDPLHHPKLSTKSDSDIMNMLVPCICKYGCTKDFSYQLIEPKGMP